MSDDASPAMKRASELFLTPQYRLPELALAFAKVLGRQYGICAEVYVTGFAAYAQLIEGLECTERDYVVTGETRKALSALPEAHP